MKSAMTASQIRPSTAENGAGEKMATDSYCGLKVTVAGSCRLITQNLIGPPFILEEVIHGGMNSERTRGGLLTTKTARFHECGLSLIPIWKNISAAHSAECIEAKVNR